MRDCVKNLNAFKSSEHPHLIRVCLLYAGGAGVVSRSPEQPRKVMGVIVVVCAAFGLTVSEAKTEIICLRTKGMLESTATFSV